MLCAVVLVFPELLWSRFLYKVRVYKQQSMIEKNLSFCGSFRLHELNNTCCFQMQSRVSQITP